MNDFFNWSDLNQLIDIPTLGNFFTWCNGIKSGNRTKKCLDRVIYNIPMLDTCNSIVCNTLTKNKSDHYPILLNFKLDNVSFRSQLKFIKMWTLSDDCVRMIKEA